MRNNNTINLAALHLETIKDAKKKQKQAEKKTQEENTDSKKSKAKNSPK